MKKARCAIGILLGMFCLSACGTSALYSDEADTGYTVTFVQTGQPDIVKQVKEGQPLAPIPQPVSIPGYNVAWDRTDFALITGDVTVTAILAPKTYTILYDLGARKGDKEAKIEAAAQTVTYDGTYTLLVPQCYGYFFKGWVLETGGKFDESGIYKKTEDTRLIAAWETDKTSERWWSNFY